MTQTHSTRGGRQTLIALLAIGIAIGTAAQARAQGFISPLIGYDFSGDARCPSLKNCQDKAINASVSLGAMGRVFGIEAEFAYAPDFFGDAPGLSSNVLTAMTHVMLVPKMGPVRPYVLAGLGLIKTHVELTTASVFTTNDNNLGWDVGGGVMGFIGDHVGLRADLRHFRALQDLTALGFTLTGSKLNYARASVGLVLKF